MVPRLQSRGPAGSAQGAPRGFRQWHGWGGRQRCGGVFPDELGDLVGHPAGFGEQQCGGGRLFASVPACGGCQLVEEGGHGGALVGLFGQAGGHHLVQFGREGARLGCS